MCSCLNHFFCHYNTSFYLICEEECVLQFVVYQDPWWTSCGISNILLSTTRDLFHKKLPLLFSTKIWFLVLLLLLSIFALSLFLFSYNILYYSWRMNIQKFFNSTPLSFSFEFVLLLLWTFFSSTIFILYDYLYWTIYPLHHTHTQKVYLPSINHFCLLSLLCVWCTAMAWLKCQLFANIK